MISWEAIVVFASPFVGSFLALLTVRLPIGEKVTLSRSKCRCCGQRLSWKDLIPIVSWLALRGRCRRCKNKIALRYLLIEAAATAVTIASVAVVDGVVAVVSCALGWALIVLGTIDVDAFRLPDKGTYPLLVTGLVSASWLSALPIWHHLAGALFGAAVAWGVAVIYRVLRKRDGLGLGDVKFMAGAGAWVGMLGLPSVVLVAGVTAIAATLLPLRSSEGQPLMSRKIAFGPYAGLGLWVVWLFGPVDLTPLNWLLIGG